MRYLPRSTAAREVLNRPVWLMAFVLSPLIFVASTEFWYLTEAPQFAGGLASSLLAVATWPLAGAC